MMVMDAAADQLTGPRKNQNDSYFVGSTWAVIADGVGSEPGSRSTADLIVNHYAILARNARGPIGPAILSAPTELAAALVDQGSPGASTVAAAILEPDGMLWLVSVGDSRFVVVRDGVVIETNHLHNQAAYSRLIEPNAEVPWGAASILTRAVSAGDPAIPEVHVLAPCAGDVVILLTDGVDSKMSMSELLEIVSAAPSPSHACHALLELASLTDLTDNATCVVAILVDGSTDG